MLKMIFFDLDGTLLHMDQDAFTKRYFELLTKKIVLQGYDGGQFADALLKGIGAMVKNDGALSNEDIFWKAFSQLMGEGILEDKPIFDAFYENEFVQTKDACGFIEDTPQTIQKLKDMGLKLVLATNPIFPERATLHRMSWAGLSPDDFEFYTVYENSRFSKPNIEYYKELLKHMDVKPEECLMVGNDVREDMIARTLGMKVFLMTADLLNRDHEDISEYPQGGFGELLEYVEQIR